METSREDVGIAIRSAFLRKGTQQRFSLFVLTVISIVLIFIDTLDSKPLNKTRSFVDDIIYRAAAVATYPFKSFTGIYDFFENHINLYSKYDKLVDENDKLKNKISKSDFLKLENTQLRKLIDEQVASDSNLVSSRIILDKHSPYLNSFVINIGSNKNIANGMMVMHGKNFIGRIVDVNYFSSRVLLVTDLNSKIPIISEPSGNHAILTGRGNKKPTLEYLPKNHSIREGDTIYTSGKEGIFDPGVPIGETKIKGGSYEVLLFTDLSQITFINVSLGKINNSK